MNAEEFTERFDAWLAALTDEEIVSGFEAMGYEFEDCMTIDVSTLWRLGQASKTEIDHFQPSIDATYFKQLVASTPRVVPLADPLPQQALTVPSQAADSNELALAA